MSSIIKPLDDAEAALSILCEEIKPSISSKELRNEYYTLLNQATCALNKVRAIAETSDYLKGFSGRSEGDQ